MISHNNAPESRELEFPWNRDEMSWNLFYPLPSAGRCIRDEIRGAGQIQQLLPSPGGSRTGRLQGGSMGWAAPGVGDSRAAPREG